MSIDVFASLSTFQCEWTLSEGRRIISSLSIKGKDEESEREKKSPPSIDWANRMTLFLNQVISTVSLPLLLTIFTHLSWYKFNERLPNVIGWLYVLFLLSSSFFFLLSTVHHTHTVISRLRCVIYSIDISYLIEFHANSCAHFISITWVATGTTRKCRVQSVYS